MPPGSAPEIAWPAEPATPEGDRELDAGISGAELRGHVQAFSSDALKGRPMGSPESLVAARYAADTLAAMGLEPAAADGTYFQRIDLFRQVYEAPSEIHAVTRDGKPLTLLYGRDFTFESFTAALDTDVLQCLLIEEEEDIPEAADASVALVFATSAGKATRWLRNRGFNRGAGFGLVLIPRKSSDAGEVSTKSSGRMAPASSDRGGVVARLRGESAKLAYAGEFQSVRFLSKARTETQVDVNVLGLLPGRGTEENPELKNEYVMLSAHRDHVGLVRLRPGQPEPEDMIKNGADDDASGCAVVLEVAEALARSEEAPARSLLVALVTGEEVGMVGSGFWAKSPTVAPESVVCALNFEMLGRPDPLTAGPGNIWLTGYERSDLGPGLRERGVEVTPDVRPKQNFFARSDNVSFARIGIVSQTLSSYGGHSDYHQASDEWDTLDYEHMEAAAALGLGAVQVLCRGDWKPAWKEGEPKLR